MTTRPNSPTSLIAALKAKPRTQTRVLITQHLAQLLESEPSVLEPLRVTRKMEDGYMQTDPCELVRTRDGQPAVEYIKYDLGYETPDNDD
tara:strand:+ start:1710 stop:1979 length:270 start_codon:yes stop_codon:yes gene_type:complete